MLEWLKGILGETYTEEIDKQVAGEIGRGLWQRPITMPKRGAESGPGPADGGRQDH